MLIATLVHRYDFDLPWEGWEMETRERLNINPAALWVRVRRRGDMGALVEEKIQA